MSATSGTRSRSSAAAAFRCSSLIGTTIEIIGKHGFGPTGNNNPSVHALQPADVSRPIVSLAAALAAPAAITADLTARLAALPPSHRPPVDALGMYVGYAGR
jgi:hypothetical protein